MQTGDSSPLLVPQGSHNDVFFEKRDAQPTAATPPPPVEGPEISEVSSLPQIREAAVQPVDGAPTAPARSYLEELVSNLNAPQPTTPAQTVEKTDSQSERGGSFFRRLFGKR